MEDSKCTDGEAPPRANPGNAWARRTELGRPKQKAEFLADSFKRQFAPNDCKNPGLEDLVQHGIIQALALPITSVPKPISQEEVSDRLAELRPSPVLVLCQRHAEGGRGGVSLFADDTAVYAAAPNASFAAIRLQRQLDAYVDWADDWKVAVNASKSTAVLFTRHRKRPRPLKIGFAELPWSGQVIYLGLTLDSQFTWRFHAQEIRHQAHKQLSRL